jgi:4'-phosphopantetheinyl transferase
MTERDVPKLIPGTIHLWEINLDAFRFEDVLSPDERARAARFRFEIHRNRFVAGRLALRRLLGAYLGASPCDVVFNYSPAGKPSVPGSTINFNLAHSEAHAHLVVGFERKLGVDVEAIRAIDDMTSVAQHSFSKDEFGRWSGLPEKERVAAFYRCWTRKEAVLKATGEGIAHRLKSFDVAFEPGSAAAILRGPESNWTLLDTSREPDIAGAIASEFGPLRLERYQYA